MIKYQNHLKYHPKYYAQPLYQIHVFYEHYLLLIYHKHFHLRQVYHYTVTPYYQGRAGTAVSLPTISTKQGLTKKEREMLDKDWWEY